MRKGGLEKVEAPARPAAAPRRWIALGALAVVAAIGGGYAFWALRAPGSVEGEPPLEPLDRSELRGYVRNAGASDGGHAGLFQVDEAVERVAAHAQGSDPVEKARALAAYVESRREAHAFEPWWLGVPRPEAPHEARKVASMLEGDDRVHLYPLEVAILAAAALRSVDVPAMVAEVWGYPNERRPLDPSGQVGYFAVAVYADEPGQGEPTFVDVYGGREAAPSSGEARVLTDVQALAAVRVGDALYALHQRADTAGALRAIEGALALDPRSPSARTTRGAVLLASQAVDEAKREVESAFQIRSDAPRRVALAAMRYVERDLDRAVSELHDAIDAYPDYALAYLRLAAVQMDQGSTALAQQSLETAERLDAGEIPELPLLWAQYYVVTGDEAMARLRARAAAERFGDLWQTQLMAAQIFRAVDDEQGMRRAVQAALAHVPESQRATLRQQIEASMGASALEPPDEEEPTSAAAPDGDLQLRLGDAPAAAGAGAASPGAGGPAILMGDPSDYHLLGPDQRLELRLND
jgi:hypothetical protein